MVKQVGCCGSGLTNRKSTIICQSRVIILYPYLLVTRLGFIWQKGVAEDWIAGHYSFWAGIFFNPWTKFMSMKNFNYCTWNAHSQPRLTAVDYAIKLSSDENMTYSRDWLKCLERVKKEGCATSGTNNSTNTLHLKFLLWLSIAAQPCKRRHLYHRIK